MNQKPRSIPFPGAPPQRLGGPGVIPPGAHPGMMPPPGQMPMPSGVPDNRINIIRAQMNPIPQGDEGLKLLRALSGCPLASYAEDLNKLVGEILSTKVEDEEELLNKVGVAIASVLRGDHACADNVEIRTAGIISEDDDLAAVSTKLKAAEKKVEKLQEELDTAIQEMQSLTKERWNTAVKKYGLNPEERLYQLDEDADKINMVSVDCDNCSTMKKVDNCKKDIAALLLRQPSIQKKREADNDDAGKDRGDSNGNP